MKTRSANLLCAEQRRPPAFRGSANLSDFHQPDLTASATWPILVPLRQSQTFAGLSVWEVLPIGTSV
jgi:hypothetical protein